MGRPRLPSSIGKVTAGVPSIGLEGALAPGHEGEVTAMLPGGDFTLGPLDVAVHGPERVAIVGDNGSGKSTLLRLLTGVVEPDEGELFKAPQRWAVLDQDAAFLEPQAAIAEFDAHGNLVSICIGVARVRLFLMDPHSLEVLAEHEIQKRYDGVGEQQRHEQDFVVQGLAVSFVTMLVELFAVVGGDRHHGFIEHLTLPHVVEQPAQILVRVADLSVVEGNEMLQVTAGHLRRDCRVGDEILPRQVPLVAGIEVHGVRRRDHDQARCERVGEEHPEAQVPAGDGAVLASPGVVVTHTADHGRAPPQPGGGGGLPGESWR